MTPFSCCSSLGFSLKLMIGCQHALLHLKEIWFFHPLVALVWHGDMVLYLMRHACIMISCSMHVVFAFPLADPSHDGRNGRSSYALLPRRAVLCCSLTMMQPESQGQAFLTAPWTKNSCCVFWKCWKLTQREVRWQMSESVNRWATVLCQLCKSCLSTQCQHKNFKCTPHLYAR